jgi:anion-transporting  ArsA/GET3 family ATPase
MDFNSSISTLDGSIVVTTESVLETFDELIVIDDLLKDKSVTNYQLIRNIQGYGILEAKQIAITRPETYPKLPFVYIEKVNSKEQDTIESNLCEDLTNSNYDVNFNFYIVAQQNTKITYNEIEYKGAEATRVIADVVRKIMSENKDYVSTDHAHIRMLTNRLIGMSYMDVGSGNKKSDDMIGYLLRYSATIRVDRDNDNEGNTTGVSV